jgi:hypothetical protein
MKTSLPSFSRLSCPLAERGTVEGHASPDARDQEAHDGYRSSLTPTCVARTAPCRNRRWGHWRA